MWLGEVGVMVDLCSGLLEGSFCLWLEPERYLDQ